MPVIPTLRRESLVISKKYNPEALKELLLQMIEAKAGEKLIYAMAVRCALREDLKAQWEEHLKRVSTHREILLDLCQAAAVDPNERSAGWTVAKHLEESLVAAMQAALAASDGEAAQRVACECVMWAETRDHQKWDLIRRIGSIRSGPLKDAIDARLEEIGREEARHLRQTATLSDELWAEFLGLPSVPARALSTL